MLVGAETKIAGEARSVPYGGDAADEYHLLKQIQQSATGIAGGRITIHILPGLLVG